MVIDDKTLDTLIACHECDAVSVMPKMKKGYCVICQRCGTKIYERKIDSINRSFAISIAGIILMIPALCLPMIGISAAGFSHQSSLIDTVLILFNQKYYFLGLCIFLFTIAFPLIRIFSTFYITYRIKYRKVTPSLKTFFSSFHHLDHWTLLNVFFLGLVVSMYKLFELADLSVDLGLLAYSLLLGCSTLINVTLDHHTIWYILEHDDGN